MSLQWVAQDDFGAGTLLGIAQEHEIGVGVEQMLNGLVDDAGDIVRRGPATRIGAAAAPAALTFVWSGFLGDAYVELVATAARMYAVVADAFIDLGPPGMTEPGLPAVVGSVVFLPNGFAWGGSTKATRSTGTVNITLGDPIITGVGTGWSAANVDPGMFFQTTGGYYRVKQVLSATQIVLEEPIREANAVGQAYTIKAAIADAVAPGSHLGTTAGRLLVAKGGFIDFSKSGQPFTFDPTDFHRLPDGVQVIGLAGIRDRALAFTNFGLWAIDNMSFDLTDDFGNAQQTLSRLTPEISLLHEAGLAEWAGTIVAPCIDRVYLIDGLSPPVPVSDSIASLYMSYVRLGYRPGGAKVFRNTFFLPILNTAKVPIALLACRLNRPIRGRQVWYPWSQLDGYPVGISAVDVDLRSAQPGLRAVHNDGWRVDLTATMPPFTNTTPVIDADGKSPIFDVQLRDLPTGDKSQPNHFRRLRLWYEMEGIGQVQAAYSYGNKFQRYQDVAATGRTYAQITVDYPNYTSLARGLSVAASDVPWQSSGQRFWTVLAAQAMSIPGVEPLLWNLVTAERQRYARARFRSVDGVAQIKIRKVEFGIRPTTHAR